MTASFETIVAPATPPGEGGIGIVRISGPSAETLLNQHFRPSRNISSLETHRLYHGRIFHRDQMVDEVMAVLMKGPRSYTREDVVEIHCHGGMLMVRRLLDLFIEAGARLARPGEFTLRAFLNGRIDLTEAEGVIDLIRARSDTAAEIAVRQMEGRLSRCLFRYREELADLLALIEAFVDFPEEEVGTLERDRLEKGGRDVAHEMDRLIATFESGRVLRDGLGVLLLGRPNVGKSSLLNSLLGEARAIVTEIPGTTRDTVEESLVLDGLPLRLIDAAGVRRPGDPIEAEGIRRATAKVASADLVLLVVDGSRPTVEEDHLVLEAAKNANCILVVNKCDLPQVPLGKEFERFSRVRISARTGEGLDDLKAAIVAPFLGGKGGDVTDSVMVSERRHWEALVRSRKALERFLVGLEEPLSPEFLALELRECLDSLGEITGETAPGEILERIFSRFCIGK